jgi:aminoglycoside phosphotransferase (APT) family kinase protein
VADAALIDAARQAVSPTASFCHLDFHPLNILMEDSEVSALLDFRNAAAGDLRVDLGLTWVLLTAPPLPPGLTTKIARVLLRRVLAGW